MNTKYEEQEIPKYLKQKESDVSKARKKSKHKHQYKECLLQYEFDLKDKKHISTSLSSYCTICGKIGGKFKEEKSIVKDFRKTIDTPIGKCYQIISGEELYEKYHKKLPVFFIKDIFKDNYVNLEDKTNER